MTSHRALGALSWVISAIAFVFATLLLFVPIGEFGSVSSPAEYRGSVYDLVGHINWLGDAKKDLDLRRGLVVFLYLLFAVSLIFALTRVGRANRVSGNVSYTKPSQSFASQQVSNLSGDKYKRCQFCAEEIQAAAVYCKHCKKDQLP